MKIVFSEEVEKRLREIDKDKRWLLLMFNRRTGFWWNDEQFESVLNETNKCLAYEKIISMILYDEAKRQEYKRKANINN